MLFTHDTTDALAMAVALVNTDLDGVDELTDQRGLRAFLVDHPMTGRLTGKATEVAQVCDLRARVNRFWDLAERDVAVPEVNALLAATVARPYLTRHDPYDWHLHMTEPEQPLADRMGAEIGMALVDLVRTDEWDRLRRCAAEDCQAVLVDLSKNRSKRYCDTGNCANRAHVAAYRARRRSG